MGAIVFIVAVMGCSRRDDDYARYEQKAWDLMHQDNRNELMSTAILSNLNRAIEMAPERVRTDSYSLRAHCWNMVGDDERAMHDRLLVIEREPSNPASAKVYMILANSLGERKEYEKALEYIDMAIELDPNYAAGRATRALIYACMGMQDKWEEELNIAVAMDPHITNILNRQKLLDLIEKTMDKPNIVNEDLL